MSAMPILGERVDVEGRPAAYGRSTYEELIRQIINTRAEKCGSDQAKAKERANAVIGWLNETDFYNAPASTQFHEAYPHGLLSHSLRVYNEMCDLIKIPKFSSVDVQSAALVCLVHDWCKIGYYVPYLRNVKNEQTGKWEQVQAYRTNDDIQYPFGHGETSMYLAMHQFKLTKDEALAIRWHMGRWRVDSNELKELCVANEQYPLVHLLQFSDQLACVKY